MSCAHVGTTRHAFGTFRAPRARTSAVCSTTGARGTPPRAGAGPGGGAAASTERHSRQRSETATQIDLDTEKRLAAEAAAGLVEDGMAVGLGTGSTVDCFLEALAARALNIRCVATSPRTEELARALGLAIEPFDLLDRLDIAVDGADQIAPDGWLVKGRGNALTREKVVAAAADRFVVIGSSDKVVEQLTPPVPLEILAFGVAATLRALGQATLRDAPPSPDGGVIADYLGPVADPAAVAARLAATPGVVEHGLFPPELVAEVLVGRGLGVERLH